MRLGIIVLATLFSAHAWAENASIGDSIALGTGKALHVKTYAKAGKSSCWILDHEVPAHKLHDAVVSAGINDEPGPCVGRLFDAIQADKVVVILPAPINTARANVEAQAEAHGFKTISYQCKGGCSKTNFHPASYRSVGRAVKLIWRTQ